MILVLAEPIEIKGRKVKLFRYEPNANEPCQCACGRHATLLLEEYDEIMKSFVPVEYWHEGCLLEAA